MGQLNKNQVQVCVCVWMCSVYMQQTRHLYLSTAIPVQKFYPDLCVEHSHYTKQSMVNFIKVHIDNTYWQTDTAF